MKYKRKGLDDTSPSNKVLSDCIKYISDPGNVTEHMNQLFNLELSSRTSIP